MRSETRTWRAPGVALGASLMAATLLGTPVPARAGDSLVLVERLDNQTLTDMEPKGDSVGDNLTFSNHLYDQNGTTKVGRDNGLCVRTVAGSMWECFRTYMLAQGQITVEGPYYDGKDSTFAITGGTGIYLSAEGEVKMQARNPERTEFTLTFNLVH